MTQYTKGRERFAERLAELCNDKKLPARGRQKRLAERCEVSHQAVGKWLRGEAYPEIEKILALAEWAEVNVNWLLQGVGPKRGTHVDTKALLLDEVLHSMPPDVGADLIDNIRAKLIRIGKLEAREPTPRYMSMLDAYESDLTKRNRPLQ